MHDDILNDAQRGLLPLMAQFRREYYLVGGTAIVFRMPSLITLAAMKAYALGRRSKWKDYVDLYFLLTRHFALDEVVKRANEIFGDLFSEKLFRAQLSYFDDIDSSEAVEYLIDNPPTDEEIKATLTSISLDGV